MAANYIVNVPKLKGRENYSEWVFAAENFLILEGMTKCIQEGDVKSFAEDDARTKAKLILTIDATLYVHIRNVKTTKELWDRLKALFDDSGFSRRISLLRNLISIRLENCSSMLSYVTQIMETGQKLCGTGFQINDEWIGSLLLAGLPEKYAPMIMAIEHSGIQITTDAIKSKLLDMETGTESEMNDERNSALASGFRGRQHSSAKKSMVAKNNHGGHNGSMSTKTKKEIKCYRCKQIGHYRSQCTMDISDNKENERKQTNAFSAVFLSGNFNNQDWYVDSGASVHLTPNEEWLQNISYEKKDQSIVVADKTKVPILCSGDVKITTLAGDCNFDVEIKDVFCVPKLTTNLLSISQLIRKGNKVEFTKDSCEIYNQNGTLVAYASLENGVYKLKIQENISAAAILSGEIWHRRLGHINSDCLNKMQNAVNGMTLEHKVDITKSTCTVCCEGKQSRLPFTHVGSRNTEVLNTIHTDICGPMECNSIGGSRYFVLFVDDFSRMTAIYFLKNKSDALEKFKEYKAVAENQTNRKIKILRSDNGGEFCNAEFSIYLKKMGIVHQTTCPYTPEQNGLCERMNRTIVEKARCMLFDAELTKIFWAEATNTAVYLHNRIASSVLQGKTPYELWHNVKPDISHLRVFGSKVMVHIAKEKRNKWDKKARECILVGYADGSKGYRVYEPNKKVIAISRDVIVVEKDKTTTTIAVTENKNAVKTVPDTPSVGEAEKMSESSLSHENSIVNTDSDSSYVPSEYEDVEESVEIVSNTRQGRVRRQPDRYGFSSQHPHEKLHEAGELTLQEALTGSEKEFWEKAVKEELQCFTDNQAWELVDAPSSGCVVQCKWVLKKKRDMSDKVLYRARLVAKGFTQRHGVDYTETFSPVVRYSTLRLLFALTVKLGLETTHLDVKTAFLNGHLEEDIFMQKPDCFDDINDGKVLKLKKAIYGLKQSSRMWYKKVDDCLSNIGYVKSKFEPCLFIKGNRDFKTIIALYVDDFFIFSNDYKEVNYLKKVLGSNFKIKDLGNIRQCLGMRINYNGNSVTLDQENYIDQLLNKFNMVDCHTSDTPMECKLNLNECSQCDNSIPYQQLIGSLMYLSVLSRPDISYSVSYLSQFNNCHTKEHWQHAKRILKYLKKTKSYALKYDSKQSFDILGYVDADWGSDIISRRSYTGFIFKLSGAAISWQSRKQRVVALSSTEAEYMGISECCKEAVYLRNLQCEITDRLYTIVVYNDNQSAQKLLHNPVFHNRSKHIDIRYHFCKEIIAQKFVDVQYLCTANMPADLLTKSLTSIKHQAFVTAIGLVKK